MEEERVQGSCLASHMVALQMVAKVNGVTHIVYENRLCNSPMAIRPLRLWFVNETTENAQAEIERLEKEVEELKPQEWTRNVKIEYEGFMSMVDGKIINCAFHHSSTAKCPFCGKGPDQFMDPDEIFALRHFNESSWRIWLKVATLHFRINAGGHYLKIACRKRLKKWIVRRKTNPVEGVIFDETKEEIQQACKARLGLTVLGVTSGGSTDDGNTARRLFEKPEIFADIVGVSPRLIEMTDNIAIALTCTVPISPLKFGEYCKQFKELYAQECGWFPLSPTIHRIVDHGAQLLELIPQTLRFVTMIDFPWP